MDASLQLIWEHKVDFIKTSFPHLHLFYSIKEGWAYVSCKGSSKRIDNNMTLEEINTAIYGILKLPFGALSS